MAADNNTWKRLKERAGAAWQRDQADARSAANQADRADAERVEKMRTTVRNIYSRGRATVNRMTRRSGGR